MKRLGIIPSLAVWLMLLVGPPRLPGQTTNGPPEFTEVYDLVRSHATGVSEAELNRAAVQGLVTALKPRVSLVGNNVESNSTDAPLVSKSSVFDGEIAYLRVARVADGLTRAVAEACQKLGGTNKLKGLVLDLRFAAGDDYAVAAATADLFVGKERPLLNWGAGVVKSKEKKDAITLPIAVLVNRQTTGAAEALAAVLRETGAALILGGKTAGLAIIAQEYPLKNGERLRIATAAVRLGDGSALSGEGLKPDITVEVSPEDERTYYTDAFKLITKTDLSVGASLTNAASGTNRTTRRNRINEADLVRERREGLTGETEGVASQTRAPEAPLVYDPALARALDLLKGLAVVHQSRS